ncbi:hypothetical protein K8Q96_02320, partial [Candidatus Nomurabacteria bacterium]|nr:hypothetical protein [Candidatus Nomurabacteria bacterium]
MTPLNSIKKVWPKYITGFFFIILLGAYANIFAIGSPYQPGSTLDPSCTPGETNCIVQIIPSQTSNANKYLTTDGTSTSWSSSTLVLGGNFTTS